MPAEKPARKMGRLTALGIQSPAQAPFYLPTGWDDFRKVVRSIADMPVDCSGVFVGHLAGAPEMRFDGTPRAVCRLVLEDGHRLGFTLFGDVRHLGLKKGQELFVRGSETETFGDQVWIKNASIVPSEWVGLICPRYRGKPRVIKAETVRERIMSMLDDTIEQAANFLRSVASDSGPFGSFSELLWQAHLPSSVANGRLAHEVLDSIAAHYVAATIGELHAHRLQAPRLRITNAKAPLQRRLAAVPFRLTPDQLRSVNEALEDMARKPLRRLLTGDVGTGKTVVYGLIAAVTADAGGRVAIMTPNKTLARQVHREISEWWPDLNPALVLGDTKSEADTRIAVGTTAIIHQAGVTYDLVIVDEQHKFSRQQREHLVDARTHLLEATATCIPRSQALLKFGALDVSKLRTCHIKKKIVTRIVSAERRGELFQRVKQSVAEGSKVLVIYPRRGDEKDGKSELQSAQDAFAAWDRAFPGMVALTHGGLSPEENQAAIDAVRSGLKTILVSTTVVEVGVTIPALRHGIVVHAERFGLTTLHQIRGRLCRDGGNGSFDLYLPRPVGEDSLARLQVLEQTTDGFEIAEQDMRQRGFGDLSADSDQQTGEGVSFLIGRPVDMEKLDQALERDALAFSGGVAGLNQAA